MSVAVPAEPPAADPNIEHLVALAGHLAEYLANVSTERFQNEYGTPRRIEERFDRVTHQIEQQLKAKI